MNEERTPAGRSEDQLDDANGEKSTDSPENGLSALKDTKGPKVHNPRELDNARYAALDCRAYSDQARALVATVTNMVAGHELAAGTRTNKRKKNQTALASTVERLLADLLLAQTKEKTKGYVYRSMRPGAFTESDVGYRVFKAVADALVHLGLIESRKGFQHWRPSFGGKILPMIRKATRFRAAPQLIALCEQHGVRAADFHQHFLIPLPEHPLQLRSKSKRSEYGDKIRGRPMRFKPSATTERLEKRLKELNAFFEGFELRGGMHRGYLRIFNNGDHPKFNWNMGGRLYSHGESNYQQMESADRLNMTINGEAVCEVDIRASYLTIFHALHDEPFDATNDPYDVPGLGPEARDIVKMWVTASFGNNAPIERWPREVVRKYRERTGKTLGKEHSARKIGEKVMQKFQLLARLGHPVRGQECGWAQLMYIESQAILETMIELMGELIPSLAVHDSIIVPISVAQKARSVLTRHYKKFAKVTPVLKTKFPEGHQEPNYNF
jgi:hypothetical protein